MTNKRQTGAAYEQIAAAHLLSMGYEILECNYRCKMGEVDIIARDGEYLVFVEVKYRTNIRKGYPLEAVSIQKQKTISKCALHYMMMNHLSDVSVRFDVVGILGDKKEHIKNAFDFIR